MGDVSLTLKKETCHLIEEEGITLCECKWDILRGLGEGLVLSRSVTHLHKGSISAPPVRRLGSWPTEHFLRTFLRDYITYLHG